MAKYKVKHTSIMHNKKVYGEGSQVELSEVDAKRLSDFIEPIKTQSRAPNTPAQTKTTKSKSKSKASTKTEKTDSSDKTPDKEKESEDKE